MENQLRNEQHTDKRTKEDEKQPHGDDDDADDSPDKRTKEDEKQHLIKWASECTPQGHCLNN